MRTLIIVVLSVALTFCETASAQPPIYQPYGAWRGRIRYVEGPWRTRTTIHWGNGITPTGGQVLIHGLTATENVLTNEAFQRMVTGLRDAEAVEKSEANMEMIDKALKDMASRNEAIRTSLQDPIPELGGKSVLDAWDLTPTKVTSLTFEATDDHSRKDPTQRFDEFDKKMAEVTNINAKLDSSASKVAKYGEFVLSKSAELKLTTAQRAFLDQLTTFARKVDDVLLTSSATDVEVLHGAPDAITELVREYENLVGLRNSLRESAVELQTLGQPLLDEDNDEAVEVVQGGIQTGKDLVDYVDEWGDPPKLEKGMFENNVDSGDAPNIPDSFKEAKHYLEETAKDTKILALEVITNGKLVVFQTGDVELQLNEQDLLIKQVRFAQRVVNSFEQFTVEDVNAESNPSEALITARSSFDTLLELRGDAESQAVSLEQEAQQLLTTGVDSSVVSEGLNLAKQIKNAVAEWGDPPSSTMQ